MRDNPSVAGAVDVENPKRAWPTWQTVVSALPGALVAIATTDFSTLGYRVQGGAVAVVAMVTAAWGIRHLPHETRLSRYARWLFLGPAAAATVAAALSPVPVAFILTAVAFTLTASTVVLAAGLDAAAELLGRAALVGGGVAFIGHGGALLAHGYVLAGAAFAGLGVALTGSGMALLTDRRPSFIGAAAASGLGIAFIGLGTVSLADRDVLACTPLLGLGAACVVGAAAMVVDRRPMEFAAVIASGAAVIATGAALVANRQPLAGGVVVCLGVTVISSALATLTGRYVLSYAAVIVSGLATVATGIAWHAEQPAPIVAMTIANGAAITGFGTAEIGLPALASGFRRVADFFIKSPAHGQQAAVAQEAGLPAVPAADTRSGLYQDAQTTTVLLQNLGPVITALQPTKDAVVRVGALLIVKVDWQVQVTQLTAAQQARLAHRPHLTASPREITRELELPDIDGNETQPPPE